MTVTVSCLQAGAYSASDDRKALTALFGKAGPGTVREGIIPSDGTDLAVTQTSTASMTLNVAAGQCVIKDSAGGAYLLTTDATTVTHDASDPTNNRIDLVIARVYDNEAGDAAATESEDSPWNGTDTATVQSVTGTVEIKKGTAASSPSVPSLPNSRCKILKQVTVRAAAASILTSDLSSTGRMANVVASGGITPNLAGGSITPAYVGEYADFSSALQRYNGTSFDPVASVKYPRGVIAVSTLTAADYSAAGGVAASATFTAVSGRSYRFAANLLGSVITGSGTPEVRIVVGSDSIRLVSGNTAAVGVSVCVAGSYVWTAASSGSTTVTLQAWAGTGSAIRVTNAATAKMQLSVEDLGVI